MTLEQAIIKLMGNRVTELVNGAAHPSDTLKRIASYCYLNKFWLMRAMAGEVVK